MNACADSVSAPFALQLSLYVLTPTVHCPGTPPLELHEHALLREICDDGSIEHLKRRLFVSVSVCLSMYKIQFG